MLAHLRQRIISVLAQSRSATLATNGPAGLQADWFPCVASGVQLYLLLPRTSDHLLNLEASPVVVVTTVDWRVRGRARALLPTEQSPVALSEAPDAPWSVVIEVQPLRVAIVHQEGWGVAETIDVEDQLSDLPLNGSA